MSSRYDTIPNCPLWIKNRKYRPSEYIKLYKELKDPTNGTVKSDTVSALLFKSGLHPQELARIWLLLNNNVGQLSEQEFVIVLALIGFGQKGTQIKDLNSLFRIGMPPVPDLSKGYSSNTSSCPDTGDDDDDDEFSDFQSAVVQTKMATTVSIKPLQPQIISTSTSIPRRPDSHGYINFNSIDINTKQIPPAPTVANINRNSISQIQSTKTNELILIGDEDKYSALRDLMELNITCKGDDETISNHNEISKTKGNNDDNELVKRNLNDSSKSATIMNIPLKSHESFGNVTHTSSADFDFGDFQSFSKPSPSIGSFYPPSIIAQTSSIGKSLVVSQKSRDEPEPPKPQVIPPQPNHNWDDGDYGVSFKSDPVEKPCSKSDNVLSTVFELKQPLKLNPSELLLDMDISSHIPSSTPPHSTNSNKDNTKRTFPLLDLDQLDPLGSSLHSSNGPCSTEGASSNSLSFQICSDLQSLNFATNPIPPLKTTLIGTLEPNFNNSGNSYNGSSDDLDSPSDFPLKMTSTNIPIPSTSKFKLDNFNLEDPNTTTKINKQLNINSPETLSIASLELGNYGDNYSIDALQIQNTQPNSPGINSLSKEEPASTTSAKQQVDKYCSFRDELELIQHEELNSSAGFRSETDSISKQKSTLHWEKILQVCINLLQQTQLTFSSTSTEVLREILCSSRGEDFMMDLVQLNTLASRIYYSWMKHGPTEVLGELHQKLEVAWDSLVPFININDQTDNFIKKFKPEIEMFTQHENPTSDRNVCCICLFGTMDISNSSEDEHWSILLDFHGKLYHLPCANLWLNEIDREGLPNDFSI